MVERLCAAFLSIRPVATLTALRRSPLACRIVTFSDTTQVTPVVWMNTVGHASMRRSDTDLRQGAGPSSGLMHPNFGLRNTNRAATVRERFLLNPKYRLCGSRGGRHVCFERPCLQRDHGAFRYRGAAAKVVHAILRLQGRVRTIWTGGRFVPIRPSWRGHVTAA
jgi:hypothetical protein